jgi:NAD(P)-dependent dehydrogenase (short-subunit alcohol dehydrogenase family)
MQIANLSAVVTGGSSGLGAATAQALADAGAKVAILDRQPPKEAGGLFCECDVISEAGVAGALARAAAAHGAVRVVVNCAGVLGAGRILAKDGPMKLEYFEQVLRVNVGGTFNVMRLACEPMGALPPLGDSGERGIVINTASIAAYEGQIGQAAYAASKGAIVSLTLPAAREFARLGIRVNAIAPGPVDTPMVAGMTPELRASLEATIPFPSRLIRPQEYASLVLHMIDNSAINGEVVRLDGALRMSPK